MSQNPLLPFALCSVFDWGKDAACWHLAEFHIFHLQYWKKQMLRVLLVNLKYNSCLLSELWHLLYNRIWQYSMGDVCAELCMYACFWTGQLCCYNSDSNPVGVQVFPARQALWPGVFCQHVCGEWGRERGTDEVSRHSRDLVHPPV